PLGGSWEEGPPSLLDVAARDRRWAQGNMQHLAVVGSAGFTWPSRAHMWIGVMSYLASPLWLALIGVGLAITAHIATVQYEYFTDELTLFPRWPLFDMRIDRKSTRLNSSHVEISYAVFCLKKKKKRKQQTTNRYTMSLH